MDPYPGPETTPLDATRIGGRIAVARLALGYRTQSAFAEAISVSSQRLNQWERGKHKPDMAEFATLYARFRIPTDWLAYGDWSNVPSWLAQRIFSLAREPTAPEAAREFCESWGRSGGPTSIALHEPPNRLT